MWRNRGFWWGVAIAWCLIIAFATRNPFFTGDSTEQLLTNPFFDSVILNIILRKTGHVVAFALLAIFFVLALRGKRKYLLYGWLLATSYGAIDEWHQSFIPARDGRVIDVFVNSFGALLGVIFIFVMLRLAERMREKRQLREKGV